MQAVELDATGFVLLPCAQDIDVDAVSRRVDAGGFDEAGTRELLLFPWCRDLVVPIRKALQLAGIPAAGLVAVQCTLFHKSFERNWKVSLHQDLSVPVAKRVDGDSLLGWTVKQGRPYVQPPVGLLQEMRAVRLHLDPCRESDGPLRIVPRSHRQGRLTDEQSASASRRHGRESCIAGAGDMLVMRPLCLHASSKASDSAAMRRVLHFLFGPSQPGFDLQWSVAV